MSIDNKYINTVHYTSSKTKFIGINGNIFLLGILHEALSLAHQTCSKNTYEIAFVEFKLKLKWKADVIHASRFTAELRMAELSHPYFFVLRKL